MNKANAVGSLRQLADDPVTTDSKEETHVQLLNTYVGNTLALIANGTLRLLRPTVPNEMKA